MPKNKKNDKEIFALICYCYKDTFDAIKNRITIIKEEVVGGVRCVRYKPKGGFIDLFDYFSGGEFMLEEKLYTKEQWLKEVTEKNGCSIEEAEKYCDKLGGVLLPFECEACGHKHFAVTREFESSFGCPVCHVGKTSIPSKQRYQDFRDQWPKPKFLGKV